MALPRIVKVGFRKNPSCTSPDITTLIKHPNACRHHKAAKKKEKKKGKEMRSALNKALHVQDQSVKGAKYSRCRKIGERYPYSHVRAICLF